MKSFNLNLLFVIIFIYFWIDIGLSQENIAITSNSDTTLTEKSDSLISGISTKEVFWKVNAHETAELIAQDIGDHVRLLPNVSSLDLGSLGHFSPLTFRGSKPQEGIVLINGIVFEDPINGSLNSNTIPINFVDEFSFRGAGAFAPFGLQAPSGILQINTYQFQEIKPYSKVTLRAGDWGYSDIGIVFGLPLSKSSSFMIGGNRQELNGFIIDSDHEGSRIQIRLSYHPHEKFALKYSVLLNRDKVEVPAPLLPDLVPGVSNARREEKRSDHLLSIKLGDLQKNNKQVRGRVFFSRLLQQSFGDTIFFKNRNISLGAGVQYELLTGNHWLAFGGEFKNYDLNSPQLVDNSDQFGHIFVRDVFQFTKNWALGIQGRLEKHSDYSIALNSSGHLDYDLTSQSKIWIGVQSARRYPSFAERYWPTQFFRGDPSLAEEKGTAFEIGFKMNKENNLKLETALFRHRVEDWIGHIELIDSIAFGPSNLGSRTIKGLDIKFIWNYLPGGQFGVIGSLLHVEEEPEKQLQVPEFSIYAYLGMGHNFFDDFVYVTLRLSGRFIGKRYGLIYPSRDSTFPQITTLGGTAVLDGKLTLHFTDAAIFLSIENLLDKRYQLVPEFFMPPKTFRFGIEWEFWD